MNNNQKVFLFKFLFLTSIYKEGKNFFGRKKKQNSCPTSQGPWNSAIKGQASFKYNLGTPAPNQALVRCITSYHKTKGSIAFYAYKKLLKPHTSALKNFNSCAFPKGDAINLEKQNFFLTKLYTSYTKLTEIKLITIGLASPERIRRWAEKTLPNGKVIGQVTNANTLHHKTFKPQKGGLFCERIFGPLKDFECACAGRSPKKPISIFSTSSADTDKKENLQESNASLAASLLNSSIFEAPKDLKNGASLDAQLSSSLEKLTNKDHVSGRIPDKLFLAGQSPKDQTAKATNLKNRKYCPICDVEYTWSIIRRYQLGYIDLVAPVTHVWYLKATPSYLSILLDMKKKHLEQIVYCSETMTLENSVRFFSFFNSSYKLINPVPAAAHNSKNDTHRLWEDNQNLALTPSKNYWESKIESKRVKWASKFYFYSLYPISAPSSSKKTQIISSTLASKADQKLTLSALRIANTRMRIVNRGKSPSGLEGDRSFVVKSSGPLTQVSGLGLLEANSKFSAIRKAYNLYSRREQIEGKCKKLNLQLIINLVIRNKQTFNLKIKKKNFFLTNFFNFSFAKSKFSSLSPWGKGPAFKKQSFLIPNMQSIEAYSSIKVKSSFNKAINNKDTRPYASNILPSALQRGGGFNLYPIWKKNYLFGYIKKSIINKKKWLSAALKSSAKLNNSLSCALKFKNLAVIKRGYHSYTCFNPFIKTNHLSKKIKKKEKTATLVFDTKKSTPTRAQLLKMFSGDSTSSNFENHFIIVRGHKYKSLNSNYSYPTNRSSMSAQLRSERVKNLKTEIGIYKILKKLPIQFYILSSIERITQKKALLLASQKAWSAAVKQSYKLASLKADKILKKISSLAKLNFLALNLDNISSITRNKNQESILKSLCPTKYSRAMLINPQLRIKSIQTKNRKIDKKTSICDQIVPYNQNLLVKKLLIYYLIIKGKKNLQIPFTKKSIFYLLKKRKLFFKKAKRLIFLAKMKFKNHLLSVSNIAPDYTATQYPSICSVLSDTTIEIATQLTINKYAKKMIKACYASRGFAPATLDSNKLCLLEGKRILDNRLDASSIASGYTYKDGLGRIVSFAEKIEAIIKLLVKSLTRLIILRRIYTASFTNNLINYKGLGQLQGPHNFYLPCRLDYLQKRKNIKSFFISNYFKQNLKLVAKLSNHSTNESLNNFFLFNSSRNLKLFESLNKKKITIKKKGALFFIKTALILKKNRFKKNKLKVLKQYQFLSKFYKKQKKKIWWGAFRGSNFSISLFSPKFNNLKNQIVQKSFFLATAAKYKKLATLKIKSVSYSRIVNESKKTNFSSVELVNNIYSLSHRYRWEHEIDWTDFLEYISAPINFSDKAIPKYASSRLNFFNSSFFDSSIPKKNKPSFFSLNKEGNLLLSQGPSSFPFKKQSFLKEAIKGNYLRSHKGPFEEPQVLGDVANSVPEHFPAKFFNSNKALKNVTFSGGGLIQKLLNQLRLNSKNELNKMDKQNRILLYELNKQIYKFKIALQVGVGLYPATALKNVTLKPFGLAKQAKLGNLTLVSNHSTNARISIASAKHIEGNARNQEIINKNLKSSGFNNSFKGSLENSLYTKKTYPKLETINLASISDKGIKHAKKRIKELIKQRDLLTRRTKLVRKLFISSKTAQSPSSMILSLLPVLPPDLRPIVKMGSSGSNVKIAASDLNRLYQRVLYRNERLKKFLKDPSLAGAPTLTSFINLTNNKGPLSSQALLASQNLQTESSTELKFTQGLLQEAVDNLIQNNKSGVPAEKDSRGRALKSLSDILKGKQGRFRQYLLGKRVDYSGRSVIIVGPKLKLHQCGIPKEMALELFLPFLLKRILNYNLARTVVGAKSLINNNKPLVWELLTEIMQVCPVLLNRAPTLHRLGIQAFIPKLVDGRAILLHPLVCSAFNADFDGDQMAVHIPITVESRAEAWKLMLSRNNLLSPATGDPISVPSQDMVLGCYYLTTQSPKKTIKKKRGFGLYFKNEEDVLKAYNQEKIDLHANVWIQWNGQIEDAYDLEHPIEIRINKYGSWKEITPKSHRNFNAFIAHTGYSEKVGAPPLANYIKTTPGKIHFNALIKKIISY